MWVLARACVHRLSLFLSSCLNFDTPWTVACQVPVSMEFSRQEYGSRLPFLSPGGLPELGPEPMSLASPVLAGGFFTTAPCGKPQCYSVLSSNEN